MITQIVTIYYESGATQVLRLSNLFQKTEIIITGKNKIIRDNLTALVNDVARGEKVTNYSYERV